jgi:uncharacterized protein YjbI with pentapeptide repeats
VTCRRSGRRHEPVPTSTPDLQEPSPREAPRQLRAAEIREARLEGPHLSERDCQGLQLIESIVADADSSAAILRRAHVRDSIIEGGNWSNADASESGFRRVEVRSARMTGINLTNAKIEDALFLDCRLDLASFRFARLERVRFEGCRMEEADLHGAHLTSVVIDSANLCRASLAEATLALSEIRGSELEGIGNPERLKGVAMPWVDIVRSAGTFAAALGVGIVDEHTEGGSP